MLSQTHPLDNDNELQLKYTISSFQVVGLIYFLVKKATSVALGSIPKQFDFAQFKSFFNAFSIRSVIVDNCLSAISMKFSSVQTSNTDK